MPKIIVLHTQYGCDTGCCGHIIEIDGETPKGGRFSFNHPDSNSESDRKKYAEDLIAQELGAEHVKDLDWENCVVTEF